MVDEPKTEYQQFAEVIEGLEAVGFEITLSEAAAVVESLTNHDRGLDVDEAANGIRRCLTKMSEGAE